MTGQTGHVIIGGKAVTVDWVYTILHHALHLDWVKVKVRVRD